MIYSALLVTVGVLVTAFIAGFIVIMFPFFSRGENTVFKLANLWARILLFISNIKVEVIGRENVLVDRPQIFMVNHQSNFDILIVQAYIPSQFRWIAKKELFAIPIFGSSMRRLGTVEIDRQNRDSAIKSLDEAAQKIREGKSVITFPEGTRSRDGRIRPFKKGIFYLAIKSGVSIIPVSIIGTRKIMPRRSLKIHPGKITMIIDKPIEVANYSTETRDELVTKVREVIVKNFYDGKIVSESGGKESR